MDRIVDELKQTKIAWAVSEESQAESEMQLKNKINTLVKEVVKSTGKAPDLSSYTRGATQLHRAKSPRIQNVQSQEFTETKPNTLLLRGPVHTTNVNCFNISCHVMQNAGSETGPIRESPIKKPGRKMDDNSPGNADSFSSAYKVRISAGTRFGKLHAEESPFQSAHVTINANGSNQPIF